MLGAEIANATKPTDVKNNLKFFAIITLSIYQSLKGQI